MESILGSHFEQTAMDLWEFPFVWALLPVGEWDGVIWWGFGGPPSPFSLGTKKKTQRKAG